MLHSNKLRENFLTIVYKNAYTVRAGWGEQKRFRQCRNYTFFMLPSPRDSIEFFVLSSIRATKTKFISYWKSHDVNSKWKFENCIYEHPRVIKPLS